LSMYSGHDNECKEKEFVIFIHEVMSNLSIHLVILDIKKAPYFYEAFSSRK